MVQVRAMLAHSEPVTPEDVDLSKGPVWVSPKLDGIRCLQKDAQSFSRTLKRLPNQYVQSRLGYPALDGLDGELVVGDPTHPNCINATTSGVMSREGSPAFAYYVFDLWNQPALRFNKRTQLVERTVEILQGEGYPVVMLEQTLCATVDEIAAAVGANYEAGYEGSIIRNFDGLYKYNRSTRREGLMLKVKESVDSEFRVTGFEEMQHNNNEAKLDERGFTKRTTHKANKVAAGTLGKFTGIDIHSNQPITVGRGKLTASEADYIWHNQKKFLGKIGKYRYGKHGVLELPRFPRFITWRDPIDL